MGMRSLDELTGRSDLLKQRDHALSKTTGLDLSFISRFVGPCQKYSERISSQASLSLPFCYSSLPVCRMLPLGSDIGDTKSSNMLIVPLIIPELARNNFRKSM